MEFILGIIFKTTITITDDTIECSSTFSGWTHARSAISGFRTDSKRIRLYSLRDMELESIQREAGADSLREWLRANYPDLDAVARTEEMAEILADDTFGQDEAERQLAFTRAKRIMYGLIIGSVGMVILHFMLPDLDAVLWCIAVALPVIAAYVYRQHRGLIRILNSNASVYPVLWPIYLACIIYMAILALAHSYIDFSPLYTYGVIAAILYLTVVPGISWQTTARENHRAVTIACMLLYLPLFSWFTVMAADRVYDRSTPVVQHVEILSRTESRGRKSTNYSMRIAPWGPLSTATTEDISGDLYDHIAEGDSATVRLHTGALGAKWYEVGAPVVYLDRPVLPRGE